MGGGWWWGGDVKVIYFIYLLCVLYSFGYVGWGGIMTSVTKVVVCAILSVGW